MNPIREKTFVPEGCVLNFSTYKDSISEDLDLWIAEAIVDVMPLSSTQWGVGEFSWRFILTGIF